LPKKNLLRDAAASPAPTALVEEQIKRRVFSILQNQQLHIVLPDKREMQQFVSQFKWS